MAPQIAADGKHSIHAGQRPKQAGKGTKGDKPGLGFAALRIANNQPIFLGPALQC